MQKKMVALEDNKSASSELSLSHSCSCNGRPSSAVWSESNEDKSLDLDSSISSQSVDLEVIEFLTKQRPETDFACCDKHFCESPFRFVLQRSPSSSSGRRTPEFQSPAASPSRHKNEVCHYAFFFKTFVTNKFTVMFTTFSVLFFGTNFKFLKFTIL